MRPSGRDHCVHSPASSFSNLVPGRFREVGWAHLVFYHEEHFYFNTERWLMVVSSSGKESVDDLAKTAAFFHCIGIGLVRLQNEHLDCFSSLGDHLGCSVWRMSALRVILYGLCNDIR